MQKSRSIQRVVLFLMCLSTVGLASCRHSYPAYPFTVHEYINSRSVSDVPADGCVRVEVLGVSTNGTKHLGAWWITVDVRVTGMSPYATAAAEKLSGIKWPWENDIFAVFDPTGALLNPVDPTEYIQTHGILIHTPMGELLYRNEIDENHAAVLANYSLPLAKAPKPGTYRVYMLSDVVRAALQRVTECIDLDDEPEDVELRSFR